MSDHKLDIDVQEIALAVQAIRAQLNIVEDMVQQSLLKEKQNGGE